jgi:hypothetical protein
MKQFIQNELFRQLRDNSQKDNLEKLYKKFARMLFAESNKLSLSDYHKMLCYAKVEFACLQNQGKMKKKANDTTFY